MKVIQGERGSGKTQKLIEECAKNGGYIVCETIDQCCNIADKAEKMGFKIPYPLSYNEYLTKKYLGSGVKRLYIDNIECLIRYISIVPVELVTTSCDIIRVGEEVTK